MTPAIKGMTTKNLRRALTEVRNYARQNNPENPLFITNVIADGLNDSISIQDFCLMYVKGFHNKRHAKKETTA